MYGTTEAMILNSGTKMNPTTPETAEYYDASLTGYVVRKVNSTSMRVITSYGLFNWDLGTELGLVADQSMRYLGEFEIVAIVRFSTGETYGQVPNRALPHWVCK